jgi:hypothetical protein
MSIKTPLPGLGSTSAAPGARQLPAEEAKAPPALRRTVSCPALLPSRAASGGAMQSRCAQLPSSDAAETEHASRGGAAENTAALSAQTAATSRPSGPSAVRTVTLSPAQVQDKAKQEALQKKRAAYTDELVFELPTGVVMQNGEPVDVRNFNLNLKVQVNNQLVACRHFSSARLKVFAKGFDPKECLEFFKSEEGIKSYFSDNLEILDKAQCGAAKFSAAHHANVSGSQLGFYIHDIALQLRERQAIEG